MDSKKKPFWLEFENAMEGAPPIRAIFKIGDDLRQDMLTLQMLRLMEKLWQRAGLDLCMTAYGCVATGPSSGIIEVVSPAETVASIQRAAGGTLSAFSEEPLLEWLKRNNERPDADLEQAKRTFIVSCAGASRRLPRQGREGRMAPSLAVQTPAGFSP